MHARLERLIELSLIAVLAGVSAPVAPAGARIGAEQPPERSDRPARGGTPTSAEEREETEEAELERLGREFGGSRINTKPSEDAEMGFQVTTQVKEVPVGGGDEVSAGDLLVRGDDAEEVALLELQKMRADSELPVERAREQYELSKVEYELKKQAFDDGAATEQEVNRARVNMRIAELDVEQARQELKQQQLQYERVKARSTRFRLRAPFDGRVASVQISPGDSVQEGKPVIRVVRIDPLWIDVHAPVRKTMRMNLSEGDPAWALVGVAGGPRMVKGRIIEVSPVAQFASRGRRVRVEIPNPQQWPPGLAAWVRFEEPQPRWRDLAVTGRGSREQAVVGGTGE